MQRCRPLLTTLLFLALACDGSPEAHDPERGLLVTPPGGVWEAGYVPDGTLIEHSFRLHNATNKTVVVTDIKTGCGCSSAELDNHLLESGDEGVLTVQVDTRGRGGVGGAGRRLDVSVDLVGTLDGKKNHLMRCRIIAVVGGGPAFYASPNVLILSPGQVEWSAELVSTAMDLDGLARPSSADTSVSDAVHWVPAGKPYRGRKGVRFEERTPITITIADDNQVRSALRLIGFRAKVDDGQELGTFITVDNDAYTTLDPPLESER